MKLIAYIVGGLAVSALAAVVWWLMTDDDEPTCPMCGKAFPLDCRCQSSEMEIRPFKGRNRISRFYEEVDQC